MKKIGQWTVGDVAGGYRRAFCRDANGECFAVTQARGGGAFTVVRFQCTSEAYERILQAGGEFLDQDAAAMNILDAVNVPDGLNEALLA